MDAGARIAELEGQLVEVMAAWKAEREELLGRVRLLEGKVSELEKLLGRNSSNSSKPPSSDAGADKSRRPENANRAARRAMARKQGKQPGTPGATLSQVTDPDVVVSHRPDRFRRCDGALDDAVVVGEVVRQVFDVPDPKVVVTEHRCPTASLRLWVRDDRRVPPKSDRAGVLWPSVKAHALYLMCAQHLPRERCAQTLTDLFGVAVSTGTLDNWMREAADLLVGFLAVVAAQLAAGPVVHADETSVRSGKESLWVHVWSTAVLTLLHVGRRDKATIDAGPLKDYTCTIVHDRLAMYFNYGSAHVLCNAHILRSLNELLVNHRHQAWATAFIRLIIDTKTLADAARTAGKPRLSSYQQRRICKRWDELCGQAARAAPPPVPGTRLYGTNKDARLIAVALAEHRDLFLAYTHDLTLPFDNNQAERDLRMIKLQAKISGEFRSTTGAERFAAVRSYVSTNRKNQQPIHQHLRDLFTPTGPWLPTPATCLVTTARSWKRRSVFPAEPSIPGAAPLRYGRTIT